MVSGSLAEFKQKYGMTPQEYRQKQEEKRQDRISKTFYKTYKGQKEISEQHKQLILQGKKNITKTDTGFTYTNPEWGPRLPKESKKAISQLEQDYFRFNPMGRKTKENVETMEHLKRYEKDPREYSVKETIQKGLIDPFEKGATGIGEKAGILALAGASSLADFSSSSWAERGESVASAFTMGAGLFASTFTGMGSNLREGTGLKNFIEIDWEDDWTKKGGVRAGKFWSSPYATGMGKAFTGKGGDVTGSEYRAMFKTGRESSEIAGEMAATYAAFKGGQFAAKMGGAGIRATKDLFGKGVQKVGYKVHSSLDNIIRGYKNRKTVFSSEPSLGAGGMHPFKTKMDFGADFTKTGYHKGEYVSGAYRYAQTKKGLEDRIMKALMDGNKKLYNKLTKQKMDSINWKPDYGHITRPRTEQLSRESFQRSPFSSMDDNIQKSLGFTEKMDMNIKTLAASHQDRLRSKFFEFQDMKTFTESGVKQLTLSALLTSKKLKAATGFKLKLKDDTSMFEGTDTKLFQKHQEKTQTKTRTRTGTKTSLFQIPAQSEQAFEVGIEDIPIFEGGGNGGGRGIDLSVFGWGIPQKSGKKKKKKKGRRVKNVFTDSYSPSLGGLLLGKTISKVPAFTTGIGIRKKVSKKKKRR